MVLPTTIPPPPRPLTPFGQRFVLAEYIRASQVQTDQLVAFIKMYNLQADWLSMHLPVGELINHALLFPWPAP